jgi:hypothetical protein
MAYHQVFKQTQTGEITWHVGFGGPGHEWASVINVDSAGYPIISFYYYSKNLKLGSYQFGNAGDADFLVAKLDPADGSVICKYSSPIVR